MKILQINKFLYPFGGAETYMFQLSEGLSESDHQVKFWGMQHDKNIVEDEYDCFASNIDYHDISLLNKVSKSIRTLYSYTNRKKIAQILVTKKELQTLFQKRINNSKQYFS